ncbi:AAA family ATPase [Vibrio cholerae]|nr:AAA family ATPase [Vibrio cholerae]EKF6287031.1 AAA family ATPase [Vibrio cholerae]
MAVKLEKLTIWNFRSIGNNPVEVELDDIVVLVGGNNFGKSTILRAYHAAVNSEKLVEDDFHNKITKDSSTLPTIELTLLCSDSDKPGKNFCETIDGDMKFVRVREQFIWEKPGEKPTRKGYRVDLDRYPTEKDDTPHVPWAADNASRKKRPKAHLIGTFDNPDDYSEAIKRILIDVLLEEEVRKFKPSSDVASFSTLSEQLNKLKTEFVTQSKTKLDEIAEEITKYAGKIVPKHRLSISLKDEEIDESKLKLFDAKELNVDFGQDGKMFPIANHGSGARRTLLWAVLKQIAELGYESSTKGKKYVSLGSLKSHLLLLDEPELSLHPSACREARNMLYDIAENHPNWQVMVTTHSPSFIDLTRDHTKIIRVEQEHENIKATTIFRPNDVHFTEDETESLKLLNMLNPDVMEFFFGGKVLLVEGDTEYSAFGKIIADAKASGDNTFDDLFILRCRGKVQVSTFMKILNHFKKEYFVLHDIDTYEIVKYRKKTEGQGNVKLQANIERNPAWTNNEKILKEMSEYSKVYSSVINFEAAYFDEIISGGKPANSIEKLKEAEYYDRVKDLLTGIITNNTALLPHGCVMCNTIEQMKAHFDAYAMQNPGVIPKIPT